MKAPISVQSDGASTASEKLFQFCPVSSHGDSLSWKRVAEFGLERLALGLWLLDFS